MLRDASRIFIAYSHRDLTAATQLHRRVVRLRKGTPSGTVFLDQVNLMPTDTVTPIDIEDKLRKADLMVVVCGQDTANRPHVQGEVALGLTLNQQGSLRILPVILAPGVQLPNGLDFQVQGIFLAILFPDIRWKRLAALAAGSVVILLLVAGLVRAGWATWMAPKEAWTPIPTVESGFDQALLVHEDGVGNTIRTRHTYVVRGTFAEDVDNTNNLFLEMDLNGNLVGAFALSEDDADPGPLEQEIERYGGMGTLGDDLAGFDWWWRGDFVWGELASSGARCIAPDPRLQEELQIALENGYEAHAQDPELDLPPSSVHAYRCGHDNFLVLIDGGFRRSAWAVRLEGVDLAASLEVGEPLRTEWTIHQSELDPAGIEAVVFWPSQPRHMLAVTRDTFWEDAGSEGGLFESHDGGLTWTRIATGPGEQYLPTRLLDVAVGPGDSRRIAVVFSKREGSAFGVAISDEHANRWQILESGFAAPTLSPIHLVGIASDDSVVIVLPGGRLARWRELLWSERFWGTAAVQP